MAAAAGVLFLFLFTVFAVLGRPFSPISDLNRSVFEELIAKTFSYIPAGTLNFRITAASAFMAALCVLALYFTALSVTELLTRKKGRAAKIAAFAAASAAAFTPVFLWQAVSAGGLKIMTGALLLLICIWSASKHALKTKRVYLYSAFFACGALAAVNPPYAPVAVITCVLALLHSGKKQPVRQSVISVIIALLSFFVLSGGQPQVFDAYSLSRGEAALRVLGYAAATVFAQTLFGVLFILPALALAFKKRKRLFSAMLLITASAFAAALFSLHGKEMLVSQSALENRWPMLLPAAFIMLLLAQAGAVSVKRSVALYVFVMLCAAALFLYPSKYFPADDFTAYYAGKSAAAEQYDADLPSVSRSGRSLALAREAYVEAQLGKREKAERIMDMAVKASPVTRELFVQIADTYFGPLDEPLTGLLYLEMALEAEPQDAALTRLMVMRARQYGDTARAARWAAHYIVRLKGSPKDLK